MLTENVNHEEKCLDAMSGIGILVLAILLLLASLVGVIFAAFRLEYREYAVGTPCMIISLLAMCLSPILFAGLKLIRPGEAMVLTLFGKYYGTLKRDGFFFVHPFCTAVAPGGKEAAGDAKVSLKLTSGDTAEAAVRAAKAKISLKAMTLNNEKQKINDLMGNPVIIGVVVIWRVVNTAKAVFNVDNFREFLSIQCDSALRNIVRLYPYDTFGDDNEKTLRGSSVEISQKLRMELQEKTEIAGLEICEARITHLSYAPEIASAMLQRQQASAIIDARQMIVDGAVGMVQMALDRLNEDNIVQLDEERKAAMVSNLLVVLCGNRDAQPIVNSGSLY